MRELVIPCDDGDITIFVNDDGMTTRCADLDKLDDDLAYLSGKLYGPPQATALGSYCDDTDYSNCAWETARGKQIGELFARVDAGEEI